jgi:ferredoxin-NADP reductase
MKLTLKEKQHLADNIWAFRFKADIPLTWIPGQFIQVEIPHQNADAEGPKRWFTVSSAPYEDIVQITTRVTDTTFKRALDAIAIGDDIKLLAKPEGDFVWEETQKPIVFVAGGIGVTPFRSIIAQRNHDQSPLPLRLIYSSRTTDIAFREEFDHIAAGNPQFKIDYVIGERLSVAKLSELDPNISKSLVYISGPEPMVESLGDDLRAAGQPEDGLKQDFFPNYTESNG